MGAPRLIARSVGVNVGLCMPARIAVYIKVRVSVFSCVKLVHEQTILICSKFELVRSSSTFRLDPTSSIFGASSAARRSSELKVNGRLRRSQ